MRSIIGLALLIGLSLPAFGQEDGWTDDMDRYLACLIGQGAVEIRKGSDASSAWVEAVAQCEAFGLVLSTDTTLDDHTGVDVSSVAFEALRLLAGET